VIKDAGQNKFIKHVPEIMNKPDHLKILTIGNDVSSRGIEELMTAITKRI